jgi:hypothetical protein
VLFSDWSGGRRTAEYPWVMPHDIPIVHPVNVSNTCKRIFEIPYNELKHEIQRKINHQFWAIGLLENTTNTPEMSRAEI